MGKGLMSKFSVLLSFLLVLQVFLLPLKNVLGATDNSILPPSNLAAQYITPDDVKLTWSAVVGATGYKIYEITEGQLIDRATVSTNSYTMNDLPQGSYSYVVSTLSANGESGPCAPLSVNVAYPTMVAPTLTSTLQNVNDIVLNWTASAYAEGYKVYQVSANGEQTLITTVTGRTYTVVNAPEGNFTYAVSSFNSKYGESTVSNAVSVEIVHPIMAAPTNFTYTIANVNDVTLKWTAATNATGYNVYQVVDGQKVFKSTVTGTSVTYTNTPGGEYVYEVHSVSSRFGESEQGSQVNVTVGSVTMLAPTNVTFTIANLNDLTLKWDAAANATSYKVYQVIDGVNVLKSTVSTTSATYTKLPAGDYTFVVHSVSTKFGESAEGGAVNVTIGEVAMTPPANVTYTIANGNDIVLKWDAATNATSYKVYQVVDGQKTLKSTVTTTGVTYANVPAGNYSYEIYSVSSRFGESGEGSQVAVTVDPVVMAAPTNPTYTTANINDVTLRWDAVQYATSYKVYQIVNGVKTLKSTVTSTSATYTYLPEGDFTYEIHAFSSRFGESVESANISFAIDHPEMLAPENLTEVIKNSTDFTLTWDAVEYATSYKVYQVVNGVKTLKSTVTTPVVNYTKMPPGDYTFEVHSVSTRFGESVQGSTVSLALNGVDLPAPTNLTYTINNGNDIKLTWTAVTGATNYKVYQIVDGQRVLKSTITGTTVTYVNQAEGDYSFEVTAFSTLFGESPTAAEIAISLQHPVMAAPTTVTQKIQNGNDVVLSWGAVQYATSYKVYEVIDGQKVLKTTVTTLSSTLTNVAFGDHVYVVHSVSTRFGESPEGTEVSVFMSDVQMQAPATASYSFVNGNDIKLTWTAVPYGTNYKVYQIIDGEKVLKSTLTTTTVTYANQPEGDYVFEIHSYNSRYGESAEAAQVTFTLVFPEMQAPANFTKTVTNVNDIVLKWNATTYATSYKVYQVIDGQKVLKNTVTTTSLSLPKMAEGQYEFVVHSVSSRFGESIVGSSQSFEIIWPDVQAPTMTSAIFNGNNITLSWQAVTWANEYSVYEVTGGVRTLVYKGTALSKQLFNLTETTHYYEIVAFSTRFGDSAPSSPLAVEIIYPEMQAPTASIKLLSSTSAQVLWNFVTYANGYNLYELVNGEAVLIAEKINNLSYTLNDLTYADHEYFVTAYSNSFGESTQSNVVLAKLIVDTKAPVTTSDVSSEWTNVSPVQVTLTATDDGTGVANTYYSLNDGEFVTGTTFTVTEQGVHKITYYSVDKVGNKEVEKTVYVKIDQQAPVTKVSDIPEWVTAATEISLFSTDSLSGVAKTFYSIDGAAFVEGTTVNVDGSKASYEISFYSVDAAGNKEEVQTIVVNADLVAPTTTSNAPTTWTNENVTATLQATDGQSGVAKTYYSIDGAAFVEGTTFTIQEEGIHTIVFYSVDLAGNVEAKNTVEVKIDRNAPTVAMDVNKEYKLGDSVQLSYVANDNLSGVVTETMSVTSPSGKTTVVTNGETVKFDEAGVYNVTVTVTDAAGNSTTITKQFMTYLQATLEVMPEVIKGNKGVFTVRVIVPEGFSTKGFDLNTATINGVNALNSNNGYYNQADLGQFKFERSHFTWTESQVTLVFRGYVNGVLVVGQKTVKVIK